MFSNLRWFRVIFKVGLRKNSTSFLKVLFVQGGSRAPPTQDVGLPLRMCRLISSFNYWLEKKAWEMILWCQEGYKLKEKLLTWNKRNSKMKISQNFFLDNAINKNSTTRIFKGSFRLLTNKSFERNTNKRKNYTVRRCMKISIYAPIVPEASPPP